MFYLAMVALIFKLAVSVAGIETMVCTVRAYFTVESPLSCGSTGRAVAS